MAFTHLQVKSGYSLMESTITIDKLVNRAVELDFSAIALTDEEVLYGTIPFYKACLKQGIKPIIGMTIALLGIAEGIEKCVLLAKNNQGYQELIRISTLIQQSEQQGIELEAIEPFTKNLICILPVRGNTLTDSLMNDAHESVYEYIKGWQKLFSVDDFYLGLQKHSSVVDNLDMTVKAFHHKYQIPLVAIHDVHYLSAEDDQAYDCLQAIKNDELYNDYSNEMIASYHLRSTLEMQEIFNETFPEALQMTEEIAGKCHVTFDFNERWLPAYPVPNEEDAHDYLKKLCYQNLPDRYEKVTEEVTQRLDYELDMIKSMQFSDYFLIVADFIHYAKENGILVGPGRGSAAGSLVAYVLKITDVDPLHYDLIFERFLNPERVTMPDIDVDFSDHRRDEVIDYVREKYGQEHVAQIITFGTFGTRSTLRALFKAMQVNEKDVDFILKELPTRGNASITASVRSSANLKDYIIQSEKLKTLFKIATKLEGLPRHVSTHAAGVVISDQPLLEHIPLTLSSQTTNLTQYPMNDLEALGLLKMDFLGLRNLTFLEEIVKSIKDQTGEDINLSHLPTDDEKTFKLLQTGNTNGVFQLESAGMKNVLTRLKPTSFEDIVAVNALYRPGPMETIPIYIKRKHHQEIVTYLHPDLEPILGKTYGVLVYQEQIMQIAYKFAGFSLGQADILRRAVSKKDEKLMDEQKESFIKGCLKNDYTLNIAEEMFTWIVKFSNYGFNRSHAVAYSKISYQLAFLKANYPAHFFKSLLSNAINQPDKINTHIKEARAMGVEVYPPSINASLSGYTTDGDGVRMGLLSIGGIGHQIASAIIKARANKNFTSIFDFCLKVPLKTINRRIIETLILSGAFDDIESNRANLVASIDQAMEQGELFGGLSHQPSLLSNQFGLREDFKKTEDFTALEKLNDEKELLGIYVTDHPLKQYRRYLKSQGYVTLRKSQHLVGQRQVNSVVIIQAIRTIRTKRGDPMAFLTLSDETTDMEAVLFPQLYRKVNRELDEGFMVSVSGKIDKRNNDLQWIINSIKPFDETTVPKDTGQLFIKLTPTNDRAPLKEIKSVVQAFPGENRIIVHDSIKKTTVKLAASYSVDASDECMRSLSKVFGEKNVVLRK